MSLRVLSSLRTPTFGSVRLFCLPFAGGSAAIYSRWQSYAPAWLHVCPVELPGRGWLVGETPRTSMDELAELMISALRPYTNTTYSIFGHSMGALLGYEIAVRLQKSGTRRACKLFASGSRAPFVLNRVEPVSHLSDADFLEHLRRLEGTPEEVLRERDLMALLVPVIRADFSIGEKYRAENNDPLDLPVTVFSGDADEHASADDMLLWHSVTRKAFRSHQLPGGHFFLNEQPESIVRLIGEELTSCCAEDSSARNRSF